MTDNELEIEVSDFGPISHAKLGLRPLTAFFGPSNTGKSYLAVLIYALHGFLGRRSLFPYILPSELRRTHKSNSDDRELPKVKKAIDRFLDEVAETEGQASVDIPIPPEIIKFFGLTLERRGSRLVREIKRCFGHDDIAPLMRKGSSGKNSRIAVRGMMPGGQEKFLYEYRLSKNIRSKPDVSAQIPDEMTVSNNLRFTDYLSALIEGSSAGSRQRRDRAILTRIWNEATKGMTGPFDLPAYYLPADRAGIMHARKAIASSLFDQDPMDDSIEDMRMSGRIPSTLSGVAEDFLKELILLQKRKPELRGRNFGKQIEDAMLGGTVEVVESAAGFPEYLYRPRDWPESGESLLMKHSSSMVSELAPVVVYLRHVIRGNSVLIVEEPEARLHPKTQVDFIRQLANLVNHGIRVIITTHSEWVLDELSNIVRRSRIPASKPTRKNRQPNVSEVSLGTEDVGAWYFEPSSRSKGSVLKEIPFDDSGLADTGFEDVANALHNDWVSISENIEEGNFPVL